MAWIGPAISILQSLNESRGAAISLENATPFKLHHSKGDDNHDSGRWAQNPPFAIEPHDGAAFAAQSCDWSIGTGAVGDTVFVAQDDGGGEVGRIKISWSNPFAGGNSSSSEVVSGDGFNVEDIAGGGKMGEFTFKVSHAD